MLSRRTILVALPAVCGLPLLLPGCRKSGSEDGPQAASGVEQDGPAQDVHSQRTVGHLPLPQTQPVVRVRLQRVRNRRLEFGHAGHWIRIGSVEDPSLGSVRRGPIRLGLGKKGWSGSDGDGRPISLPGSGALEGQSVEPHLPLITLGKGQYPGTLRMVARSDVSESAFDVVNHTPLEAYLPGVLSGELYAHWPLQTFKAQAVAARSFAAAEHAYFANRRHYDLTDTQRSQVYEGSSGLERAMAAVAETWGEVLGYGNTLVPGYYSSCCGGLPAQASDAIGSNPINDIEPLRGRGVDEACIEAPVYAWRVDRGRSALRQRLAGYGQRHRGSTLAQLTGLSDISVSHRNHHGRPIRFSVTGSDGNSVETSAETLRSAVNASVRGLGGPATRLKSTHFSAGIKGDTVTFTGNGFGHGVGLCQYGAEARARAGDAYGAIIRWYYPGAEIVRVYG